MYSEVGKIMSGVGTARSVTASLYNVSCQLYGLERATIDALDVTGCCLSTPPSRAATSPSPVVGCYRTRKRERDGRKGEKDKNKKEKKEKKKKNKVEDSDGGDSSEQSIDATSEDQQMGDDTDAITFDEALMSNLQKQFEKAAAEAGMPVTPVTAKVAKKRKRSKSSDRSSEVSGGGVGSEGNVPAQDGDKSGKKVRFSMKSNLVWNPPTPLPPQCLRLPPSATPRGSALKSGVRPGPIKESSTPVKKAKAKAKSAKKLLKKSPSSAVKRLRKLQTFSS